MRLRETFRMSRLGMILGMSVVVAGTVGCPNRPTLTSLDPMSGPPGTVVEIEGSGLGLASVLWDAGTASETTVDSSFLSARFFTVPLSASPGNHPVQLVRDGNRSTNVVNFNVTSGVSRPEPRIDDITAALATIGGGNASMVLMVHGANFDVGAEVSINGAAQSTEFSRLLRNNAMNASDPSTLGYPIFHYATLWVPLSNMTPGETITVQVENQDGMTSNTMDYEIAASMDELDSDGDGLPDDWEENGYDADNDGEIDVDLPALGADPLRKDLFVEVDWMDGVTPNGNVWANAINTFANAPVLNSDGSAGIELHIDRGSGSGGDGGDVVSFAQYIRYDNFSPRSGSHVNFNTIKSNNFDSDRAEVFRYCVFANDNGHFPGSSGQVEDIPGAGFYVTLGSWHDGNREDFQTGTFLHEFGHALNLRHGGFEDANSKDNYNSIMQYGSSGWIMSMGRRNVYGPSQFGGIDTDCDLSNVDAVYTYSQGQRRVLDESSLDENLGVCDMISRDFNFNGTIDSSPVSTQLDDQFPLTDLEDNADWAQIQYELP